MPQRKRRKKKFAVKRCVALKKRKYVVRRCAAVRITSDSKNQNLSKNESDNSLGPFNVVFTPCGALYFPEERVANKGDSLGGCHL